MTLRCLCAATILAAHWPISVFAEETKRPHAAYTASDLVDGISKQCEALHHLGGLEVEYRMETEEVEPKCSQGWTWHWAEATNIIRPREPGKVFVRFRCPVLITDTAGKKWEEVQTKTISSDGDMLAYVTASEESKKPTHGLIQSAANNPGYDIRYNSYYFRFIAYPVAPDPEKGEAPREKHPEGTFWLPESLTKNRDKYRVRPEQEQVDSVWCHVLERPGLDVMWVQAEPTFVIRRRQFHWEEGGQIRQMLTYSNIGEVAAGVWLPRDIIYEFYGAPWEPPELQQKVGYRLHLIVSKLVARDIVDSEFRAQFPAGAMVSMDDNRRFINQPGVDPYQRALELVPPPSGLRRWWLFVAALALAGLLALIVWRIWVAKLRRGGTKGTGG